MPKREVKDKRRYFYALTIAIFLFILGFLISYSLNLFEFERVSNLQDAIYYDFYANQLSYDFFNEKNCDTGLVDKLSESLDFEGDMLNKFEQKFGKDNSKVLDMKKYYFLIQLSHFNFMKQIKKDCDLDYSFILFFYSNDKTHLDKSERIGNLLNYFKKLYPSVLIYSFDSESPSPLIRNLKSKYNVTESVSIILDEKVKLNDIEDISQLEEYLF